MNNYKALGSLVGFESTLFDEKEKLINKWVVNGITIMFEGPSMKFDFIYSGYHYELIGKLVKKVYYEAVIYCDKEECGKFHVWVYTNEKGCILLGQWIEDNVDNEVWGRFDWKK